MVQRFIECPICEGDILFNDIPVNSTSTNQVQFCPHCQQPVSLSEVGVLLDDRKKLSSSNPKLAPEALVKLDATEFKQNSSDILKSSTREPDDHELLQINDSSKISIEDNSIESIPKELKKPLEQSLENTHNPVYYQKTIEKRRRQTTWFFISTAALLLLTIILLIPVVSSLRNEYLKNGSNLDSATNETLTGPVIDVHDNDLAQQKLNAPQKTPVNSADRKPSATNDVESESLSTLTETADSIHQGNLEPPPFPRFLMFSRRQTEQVWQKTKPHLVGLEIHGPRGVQPAVGILVDSRGWIATSYNAIIDAWKIEVTSATEPANRGSHQQPLRDTVRGIVAFDPDVDIAILAVNRRFVVSLADIPIAPLDRLVKANHLLAFCPPNQKVYYGVGELRIDQRGQVDQLPQAIQRRLAVMPGDVNQVNWMVLSGDLEILPGMPLMDQDGQLQGIVSVTHRDQALAVPASKISSVIEKSTGKITPLKPPTIETESGTAIIAIDHPATKIQQQVQIAGSNCKAFDWIPEDTTDFELLIEFMKAMQAVRTYLKENKPDYRDSAEVQAARSLLMQTRDEFQQQLFNRFQRAMDESDPRLLRLNELASEQLKLTGDRPVLFSGIVDPNITQQETVLLQFDDTQQYVTIDYDASRPVMRPGSRWLLLTEQAADKPIKSFRFSADRRVSAFSVQQIYEIGPFN